MTLNETAAELPTDTSPDGTIEIIDMDPRTDEEFREFGLDYLAPEVLPQDEQEAIDADFTLRDLVRWLARGGV